MLTDKPELGRIAMATQMAGSTPVAPAQLVGA